MLSQNFDIKIAAIAAISGILLLSFMEISFKPRNLKIGEISLKDFESTIEVNGRVEWGKKTSGALMLGLNDGNKINAVIFSPNQKDLDVLKRGNAVKAVGKVKLFNEKLELVIEKVEKID